ncbi:unnamed protein product [Prorocentrum cordatum]|uniref:Uncharacterized protein n=1 Tax=Prorocentrum cordatum TaxID=2364126 RepID=A0ABN9RPR9_9DINO|nr:unnamed protein product [Polarella glacialis]
MSIISAMMMASNMAWATTGSATTITVPTDFVWQPPNHAFDNATCEGMALGAHPSLPSHLECGQHCDNWIKIRSTVKVSVAAKAVDLAMDVMEIPFGLLTSGKLNAMMLNALGIGGKGQMGGAILSRSAISTFLIVSLIGDIGVVAFRMTYLYSTAGFAELFVDANCFEHGTGSQHMTYIKDNLAGAWQNGLGLTQLGCGLCGFVLMSVSACLGEKFVDAKACIRWLAVAFSICCLVSDIADFVLNTLVISGMIQDIEAAILGDGSFADGSNVVIHWRDPKEPEALFSLWWAVIFAALGSISIFCASRLISFCCCSRSVHKRILHASLVAMRQERESMVGVNKWPLENCLLRGFFQDNPHFGSRIECEYRMYFYPNGSMDGYMESQWGIPEGCPEVVNGKVHCPAGSSKGRIAWLEIHWDVQIEFEGSIVKHDSEPVVFSVVGNYRSNGFENGEMVGHIEMKGSNRQKRRNTE